MNLAEKLAREIERVTVIRSQYERLRSMPNVIVEPQIAMMTADIDAGKAAAGSGDVATMIGAVQRLESWAE